MSPTLQSLRDVLLVGLGQQVVSVIDSMTMSAPTPE
jgi:hypothetical protein